MEHEPIARGLRLGGLVEIHGLSDAEAKAFDQPVDGEYGQVVSYSGGDVDKFKVHLANGVSGSFSSKNVKAVSNPKKPGEGGDKQSFDLLVGPRTESGSLGQELFRCMLEKGFCVLKYTQSTKSIAQTVKMLNEAGGQGNLSRLPEECEAGYLGRGCKGKVQWFDPDYPELMNEDALVKSDADLSAVAEALAPFAYDVLDDWLHERTPALVCLSLPASEEQDYPFPEPDDHTLGRFLMEWRRTLVRAVHFMGPGSSNVTLERLETPKAHGLPNAQRHLQIEAMPNTILLFRSDVYDYKCNAPQDTLMMLSSFLSRGPTYEVLALEGNTGWLQGEGPPPPVGDSLHVVNTSTRLAAGWDSSQAFSYGLKLGGDSIINVPILRWDTEEYWSPNHDRFEVNQTTTKHQSFCEGAEYFDSKYFEISFNEAGNMDPVQRLILETGAHCMHQVGLSKKVCNKKSLHAGFAVGNDKLDFQLMRTEAYAEAQGGQTTSVSSLANRFSFTFNLRGPNYVCDTACSAAMCATHMAKYMMMDKKFDPLEFFICMGAHLCLSPGPFIICSQAHMTSWEGRCFTFNSTADGFARGEGVSGFMMKYGNYKGESEAILRATQFAQDGRSACLTAPNGPAQADMITKCFKEAGMTAADSTVWECHGLGTKLGDPVEIGAVRKVLTPGRMPGSDSLLIGASKTNTGHLEGGSAMAAICKSIIVCSHTICYPLLHAHELNVHLEHDSFEHTFQTECGCYLREGDGCLLQAHCQVTSLGFGGSNGHAIFWGENLLNKPDLTRAWERKVNSLPAPEVRPFGDNPDDWEADFPDTRTLGNGAKKYKITLNPDDGNEQPVRYELEESAPDLDAEDEGAFYSISGNFNAWGADPMLPGAVAGIFKFTTPVPESGILEWRFVKNGDADAVIGPKSRTCHKRSEVIIGPVAGLKNKWVVHGEVGQEVSIEFFSRRRSRSILWLVSKD